MQELALLTVKRLREAGYTALYAGGCVRDMLSGTVPHDYDVATDATPTQVRKLFRKTLAVGAQFGVIEVLGNEPGLHVQVATFRSDGNYSDGRHPDSVRYGTAQEDALRRDFTINGLFFDPLADQVIDYVGGQQDLQKKIVRAIGNPLERIKEDKLRMLRAIRFVSRLGFELDQSTANAIVSKRQEIKQVSAERITDELKKMLVHPHRLQALNWLLDLQVLPVLLPEFNWTEAKGNSNLFSVTSQLPAHVNFPLVWAALLEDAHKTLRPKESISRHELHDNFGKRFRLSLAEIAHVEYLVDSYRIQLNALELPWAKLKPMLADPRRDDLLVLMEAAAKSIPQYADSLKYCQERLQVWTKEQLEPAVLVTGEDVAALGIPPGPRYKQLLEAVRTAQLNEELGDRTQALQLLQKLASKP